MRSALAAVAAATMLVGCGAGSTGAPRVTGAAPVPAAVAVQPPRATARTAELRTQVPKPHIVSKPIPFGAKRRRETAAYAQRHYGRRDYRITSPHVIVEHWTAGSSLRAAYDTFARDVPDVELHELPGVCSHFVINSDGTIYALVPTGIMCRHTVGLNYTAIGIEHVGRSDSAVLGNPRVLKASLRLTRWLRCTRGIRLGDVIGHNESLRSPFHHERVRRLRSQTHGDMRAASMRVYRAELGRLGCG